MRRLIALAVAAAALASATSARALPEFARKTGMACSACHDSWPRLNDVGELFLDRGFRTGAADDDSWGHIFSYFPISFRGVVGYQFSSTTHQATDSGDTTINTGGFAFPGVDLYFGTALSKHFSVYVDVTGFGKDGTASVQSTWVRINDVGTRWVNIKVGLLELDLPFSVHRANTLAPYAIYSYHPTGSSNGFNIGDNQLGVEIMGHDNGPGLRYALTVASSGDITSAWALDAPSIYAHVTYTKLFRSRIVPRLRVGALGDVGWWPTAFKTLIPMGGGMPAPVPGTGEQHKVHAHAGAEAQVVFGELARPIVLTVVWMYGQEEAGLIASGTQDARFHGGFVQLDYTPIVPLTFGARYDGVYNLQQADPTQPSNSNQQDGFTAFVRYQAWASTWGSVVAHTEVSTFNTQNAAVVPTNPARNTSVFAGFDLVL